MLFRSNTSLVPAGDTPLPNKNMELAQKTVAGVTTQYYGFAGYCASYYLDATQANASATNIVSSYKSSIQYGIHLTGGSSTRLTVYNAGVYKVSGALNFNCTSSAGTVSVAGGFNWSTVVLESTVDVWIKKNGVDVPFTKIRNVLIGDSASVAVNIDYMITLSDNDYIEVAWQASDANTSLTYIGGDFPSALINMNMVR